MTVTHLEGGDERAGAEDHKQPGAHGLGEQAAAEIGIRDHGDRSWRNVALEMRLSGATPGHGPYETLMTLRLGRW